MTTSKHGHVPRPGLPEYRITEQFMFGRYTDEAVSAKPVTSATDTIVGPGQFSGVSKYPKASIVGEGDGDGLGDLENTTINQR